LSVPQYAVPQDVRVVSAQKIGIAEVNNVYRCVAERKGQELTFYLKVNRGSDTNMPNERDVLIQLAETPLPTPKVLWHGRGKKEFMAIEERPGVMLLDLLSPASPHHKADLRYPSLEHFGQMVGRLHSLDLKWPEMKRTSLYSFLGEEEIDSWEFGEIVLWLKENPPPEKSLVFTHGDLNDRNVLVQGGQVTAILDWESAGTGWREYDLAWVLRERRNYMNTPEAKESFLRGYLQHSSYDPDALRWCMVMNCLHVAYWCRDSFPYFKTFNLEQARRAMFAGYE
jgi:aminoglycoside phosphotransferase (APT) family kinase protein